MVGVPGKYRGCETCRSRRVKCGNERPICKRCADSHRDCTYERETVFIVASIEDGGRCSSHPPRKTAKKVKSPSRQPEEEKLELVVAEPLTQAWDDFLTVSNHGKTYSVQIAALHTPIQSLARSPRDNDSDDGGGKSAPLSLTPYEVPDVQPSLSEEDFQVRSKAMVHLAADENNQADSGISQRQGIFLFLYEHNNSTASAIPPWRDPNPVRQQGPEAFRSFPHHHYFVRVFRHNAICAALLNRKPTFLSEPPWVTAPWEFHPKSLFDRLLDVVVALPSLLTRADRIVPQEQTLARRLAAQDLLANCIQLESQFNDWLTTATTSPDPSGSTIMNQNLFWIADPGNTESHIPFAETFGFRDGLTASAFVYYWMAQMLFYPCIERLYWTIFEPVVDGPFPQTVPVLPGALQINPLKYSRKEVGGFASNICRALDFALRNQMQPDMLVVPLAVVCQYYQHIGLDAHGQSTGDEDGMGFGDGRLELMWCEAFRARLIAKGRDMQEIVQGKQWRELAAF
ncbi:hypothetical protein QBC47DRAFT_307446 [Echria macrotheca]|uniref:Zn(2)-C6 fungal-type domain-containing protein n=1 Tax=Echria macrotheca TaxID=438768 RepID=A0AAJ0F7X4_9PEZI|nr:hypothetical protein QBC47DRAFT_307446 [Echria macrotheca]